MATSGTTAFALDLGDLIEEAFERAGVSLRGGFQLKSARRSLNLLFQEWANKGLNMWTIEEGNVALVSGTSTYNLPSDTVDLIDAVVRRNNNDYSISRISVSTYSALPNKSDTGQPSQYYINRVNGSPTISLYPAPSATFDGETLVYWRIRQMEDIGSTNMEFNPDVPARFLPALVSGLAYQIALKHPEAYNRLPILKAEYDAQYTFAAEEDRERASWFLVPEMR